jgi:hypothetical protein
MPDVGLKCAHGYNLTDADECQDCLKLETAKIQVLKAVEFLLYDCTEASDNVTRALVMTAAGHYVSMKLHAPEKATMVLRGITAVMEHSLPAPPEEILLAQQQFLAEMSFEAREPEVLACRYSQTWVTRLYRRLQGRILRKLPRTLMLPSSR